MRELLKVDHVSKHFGGLAAVNDVSFVLRPGEKFGLIGPNGAGKTTLFNIITGFSRAESGKILFDSKDITRKTTAVIVSFGIARTFQIVRPFSRISVFNNVLIPALSPNAARWAGDLTPTEIATDSLKRVGLAGKMDLAASELTHAELKRLELGRAIATKPKLLLLDEPYGGLGSNEIQPTSKLIGELASSGMTLLIIEHRLKELMKNVDAVIVMDQGRIIASGTPEEAVNNPQVIDAYLGKAIEEGD